MTKTKFFAICATHKAGYPLTVNVGRIDRDLFPVIYLSGSFPGSNRYTLFTPQWRKLDFREWDAACQKHMPKFERWLAEWKSSKTDKGEK